MRRRRRTERQRFGHEQVRRLLPLPVRQRLRSIRARRATTASTTAATAPARRSASWPGYCGDGIQNGPEQCDAKDQNKPVNNAYGVGICTTACTYAPFCGDARIQSQFGEQCEGNERCLQCKFTIIN